MSSSGKKSWIKRPIVSLWPFFVPMVFWPAVFVLSCFATWFAIAIYPSRNDVTPHFITASIVSFLISVRCVHNHRWLWRLCRSVWHFQTESTRRVVLHFDPTLKERWDFDVLFKRFEAALDDLALWFDISFRRRLVVYLFPSYSSIQQAFQQKIGGTALKQPNAIVITADSNLEEIMRHEITHLYSFHWNRKAPPLLSEGLAVWLQGTNFGMPIDFAARLVSQHSLSFDQLLKPNFFFSPQYQNACYCLAGSFTGFLIRRYGWNKYRQCYRSAGIGYLRRKFKKTFGLSLKEAESKWQTALMTDDLPPMKVLRKRLERDLAMSFAC